MVGKFLFYPVKPFIITQSFGENTVCIHNTTGKIINCDGLNPPPGYRSVYSKMDGHNGVDLVARRWQPIYAAANGIVTEVSTEEARGLGIGITSPVYIEKSNRYIYYKHRYWHLVALNVHEGERVKIGQLIGWADSTGYSSGDHLHFEVKRVDKTGKRNLNQNNGYFGAEDPMPLFYDKYAEDLNIIRWATQQGAKGLDFISDWLRKF